uniref:Uncharacterized protein n=1 Tax=Physcomitrium patens TaxID=3218 RepID=A0A2K1J1H1_PHYPA|nr:hypothetical protein PHYPA_023274 [Physcomitrium patens]
MASTLPWGRECTPTCLNCTGFNASSPCHHPFIVLIFTLCFSLLHSHSLCTLFMTVLFLNTHFYYSFKVGPMSITTLSIILQLEIS